MRKKDLTLMALIVLGMFFAACDNGSGTGTKKKAWESAIPLYSNTWGDGELASKGEQWFKFTATASTQYVHVSIGTIRSDLSVELYDSTGNSCSSTYRLGNDKTYVNMTVANGSVYHIKVKARDGYYSGTYKIAFNTFCVSPSDYEAMNFATSLSQNVWANGIAAYQNEWQWFKFTPTTNSVYLHVSYGSTMGTVYVMVYDRSVPNINAITTDPKPIYSPLQLSALNTNTVYYVKVWPYIAGKTGTYKIAFNTSYSAPN